MEENRVARVTRMYRNQWVQAKLDEQTHKKKGQKNAPKILLDKTKKGKEEFKYRTANDGKKKKKDEDHTDYEEVIDGLKEEIYLKDQEFKEVREELDKLRGESQFMRGAYKQEKF